MTRGLNIEKVCELLLQQKVIDSGQRDTILSRADEQYAKLKKLSELKQDLSSDMAGFDVVPSDVILSLNIKDAGGTEALSEEQIMRTVARGLKVPFKKIDPLELDLEVVTKTVSKAFAVKHLAVPVAVENGELRVAMVDPTRREVLEDIRKVQKLKAVPVVSTKSDIVKLIREFYGFKQSVVMAERELVAPLVNVGNLEQYAKLGTAADIETTDKYVQNAVDYLFRYALEQRASDIHIEPKREKGIARLRIDGVLHTTYSMPLVVHNAVVSRIKSLSRLNIAEKRRPQDGRIKLKDQDRDIEIRVSTIPVAFGEKVVLRLMDPQVLFQDLEELGFLSGDFLRFKGFLERPNGIILVTGPTGSGKTTTLYSSLRFLASAEINITTVEDPIEMVCEDYNQIAVQPSVDVTFASILRNILRQDPDIIMIGEIRDRETARNAIQAALTGHLVLSTLHTNDAASAVTRLIDLEVEPFLISSTLLGVVAQRLVRTVCRHCEETFDFARDDLLSLGLDLSEQAMADTIQMHRGRGCRHCRDTGYLGRTAVFEVLSISEAVKDIINSRGSSDAIRKAGCREGMKLLRENAVVKILKGRTTYNEVLRCISQED